jgi:hypothetical protein
MRELWNVQAAATRKQQAEHDARVVLAWQTVAIWVRSHRRDGGYQVPALKELLNPSGQQPPDTQWAVWRHAADIFGLRVEKPDLSKMRIVWSH